MEPLVGRDLPPEEEPRAARPATARLPGSLRCWACVGAIGIALAAFSRPVFLQREEQLLLVGLTSREVVNGPGFAFFVPAVQRGEKRRAVVLDEFSYVVVTDTLQGTQRVVGGPQLFFPGAYDSCGGADLAAAPRVWRKVVLEKDEYVKLVDSKTGGMRVVSGPDVFVPEPTEAAAPDTSPGPRSADSVGYRNFPRRKGVNLRKMEYVVLTDIASGSMRVAKGPQLVFPGPHETLSEKQQAFKLEHDEWLKLLDTSSGAVRVLQGEQIVFPTATESLVDVPEPRINDPFADDRDWDGNWDGRDRRSGVHQAVKVDHDTAVLVLDKQTGEQRLVEERGNFFPSPYEDILEVRKVIFVEPHEVVIVSDKRSGELVFHNGSSEVSSRAKGTRFFLPPHCELLTMHWGSGTSPQDLENNVVSNTKTVAFKVPVTKVDLRAQYAFFEYDVRTSDNVELVLEGTIFWQVIDVPRMVAVTADPKGDVWYHARSAMIQAVARKTLEEFMAGFNEFAQGSMAHDEQWYTERGVKVHNVEVIRYECKDERTAAKLQEIIQETTDKINRLQKQSSENEVEAHRMAGQVEVEKKRTDLIETKTANERLEKQGEGEAYGLRLAQGVRSFVEILEESVPQHEQRLELFRLLEQSRTVIANTQNLAQGSANLFLTPKDLNLKLQMPGSIPGIDD